MSIGGNLLNYGRKILVR